MTKARKKQLFIFLAFLILIAILFYFYTYFFANKHKKVIYQDAQRRIYLIEKKEYKKGREMWRMVYEDQKTGNRFFVLGNTRKNYSEKNMSKRVLNTIEQGQMKSYDQVDSVGLTMRKANTDIHSNLIEKNNFDVFGDLDKDFNELSTSFN